MLVDADAFRNFVTARTVSWNYEGCPEASINRIKKASIERQRDAFLTLREIRNEVLVLTDIADTGSAIGFSVVPGLDYADIMAAVHNMCVWSTQHRRIDYNRTLADWGYALEKQIVSRAYIEAIYRNDLHDPRFGDFNLILTEFLLTAVRKNDNYVAMEGFKAV